MKKQTLGLIVVMMASLLLVSCPSKESSSSQRNKDGKKTLVVATPNPRTVLDMHFTQFSNVMSIYDHIVQTLYEFDENLGVRPLLAEAMPSISEDGLVYTFTLKEGITFHDGSDLTSEDVQFLFQRMFDPSISGAIGISTASYEMIVGAKDLMDGKVTGDVAGFKILDDYTFEIHLEYPFAPFIQNLAMSYAGIIPKKGFLANQDSWGTSTLIGSGYYKLKSYHPNTGIVIEADPQYRDGRAPIDIIDFHYVDEPTTALLEYERGSVDIAELPVDQHDKYATGKFASEIHGFGYLGTYMIVVNMDDPAFSNLQVREAFAYALDRDTIINQVYKNLVDLQDNFLPAGIPGRSPNVTFPAYDPAKAKALLAEAGYPNGVEIEAIYRNGSPARRQLWATIQAKAKEAGFHITATEMDVGQHVDLSNQGLIPMYDAGWIASYPDADDLMYTFFHSKWSHLKSSNLSDPRVDALLDAAQQSTDPEARRLMYEEAEELVLNKYHAVYPYSNIKAYNLIKPHVINPVRLNGIYRFWTTDIATN